MALALAGAVGPVVPRSHRDPVDPQQRSIEDDVRRTHVPGCVGEFPGGYVEPGESLHAARTRELMEEIGLARDLEQLLVVDWAPSPDEGDKLLFVFDGGIMSDAQAAALSPDG